MRIRIVEPARHEQRGQTIVLVALSMVFVIAMAALAIDLTTLYVARGEMQRAADGAALAGAKAFVESGITTNPNPSLRPMATALANAYISAVVSQNEVGKVAPTLVSAPANYGTDGNPQITVTLKRTNVPTFFSRIFGRTLATVTASATAEAYNPSGYTVPIAPRCVKPWVVANKNPKDSGNTFVNAATGAVTTPGTTLGEQIKMCFGGGAGCTPGPTNLNYVTAQVAALAANSPCPSCDTGANAYEESVDCCNNQVYQCGDSVVIDTPPSHGADTSTGIECLIHSSGPGPNNGQDTIDTTQFPLDGPIFAKAGDRNPTQVLTNTPINSSDSIVTMLISTATTLPASGSITIGGFVRAFVSSDDSAYGGGDIQVTFLNVAGCNSTQSGTAISGGGISPIPVRLIHN